VKREILSSSLMLVRPFYIERIFVVARSLANNLIFCLLSREFLPYEYQNTKVYLILLMQ